MSHQSIHKEVAVAEWSCDRFVTLNELTNRYTWKQCFRKKIIHNHVISAKKYDATSTLILSKFMSDNVVTNTTITIGIQFRINPSIFRWPFTLLNSEAKGAWYCSIHCFNSTIHSQNNSKGWVPVIWLGWGLQRRLGGHRIPSLCILQRHSGYEAVASKAATLVGGYWMKEGFMFDNRGTDSNWQYFAHHLKGTITAVNYPLEG